MVLAELCITPMGKGDSVSEYVTRCVKIIDNSGLNYQLTAMGTIVEGDLATLLEIIQKCFDALQIDCDRITCTAKFDYRQGRSGRIQSKVQSVVSKMEGP